MTNIGKINTPTQAHQVEPKEKPVKEHSTKEACECEDCKGKKPTNLNKDPNAVIGQSMVKKATPKKGEYKFNPDNVRNDVEAFRENYSFLKSFKDDLARGYVESGMSEEAADHWSYIATTCLASNMNR